MDSQQHEPLPRLADRVQLLEARCREQGLALTVHRREVLAAVLARTDHPTADQIYDDVRLRIPDISRTTVYRVLDTLVQLAVIGKPEHLGATMRYEPNVHRHHHLICVHCAKVIDVDQTGPDLDFNTGLDSRESGFLILDYSINFQGICAECRKNNPPQPKETSP